MLQINWESFRACNQEPQGLRYKFEDLCRQLFINENISDNVRYRYLHANPNNYGLETEPIYDEKNKRKIGFQAKFFDGDVDYSQIKRSAEKIVEYYTGKVDNVDLVYLFCNKPIANYAKGYINIARLLEKSGIELQLVTDNAILDLVREKYPYLALYYFNSHSIDLKWFIRHTDIVFRELGERYNKLFNVETEYSNELSLFVHDQRAAAYLNQKKISALSEIANSYNGSENKNYLSILRETIVALPDVTVETLYSATDWIKHVNEAVKNYLDTMRSERNMMEKRESECYQLAFESLQNDESRRVAKKEYDKLKEQIREIETMISLSQMLEITDREKQLIQCDVLTITGDAGEGKTQLLATETQKLLDEKRSVLLLAGDAYSSDDSIQGQIMKNLMLDYNFENLIDILEAIGEKENRIVPIFIDAINETWNRNLWKSGLVQIIDKIKNSRMVKLVLSYRPEYEKSVLPECYYEERRSDDILTMHHNGFENNSIEAIREFLNHFNILFTPLEYFSYEMSNPLFLMLYCKTYNGEEVSLPELYERLLRHANTNIHAVLGKELRTKGYCGDEDLVGALITQIAKHLILNGVRFITKEELTKLSYWREFDISIRSFIRLVVREHILHDSCYKNEEIFWFAYDQMNDYYCAKAIIKEDYAKDALRAYLADSVLEIKEGEVQRFENIGLFVNVCALYAEKYGEECIDIIDTLGEEEQQEVFSKYIDSFQWRNAKYISKEQIYNLLRIYPCDHESFWAMLIGNSVKVNHPLNANFLHDLLSNYKLSERDARWTIYINGLTENQSDRVIQLVRMYNGGEKLETKNEKQVELLLTLFSWLLTSSNRWLRDYTSKAMVEILKEHFSLCQVILEKFNDVNDPYVIQRLYGIVFGACCKKENGELQSLAEYVYKTIFNQEKVYPDILLRDYARLIVEKSLCESPENEVIKRERILPPYASDPIPEIEDQHYLEKQHTHGLDQLIRSMKVEGMGMYGDFGRYVFQSALYDFDVDNKKMFNYAIYYILTELGYNKEYFGEYDRYFADGANRYRTKKTERIGKKYQWIVMYNMLARISDHSKMRDRMNYPEENEVKYEGPWEPYVRDFDPTLNQSFMICKNAPHFDEMERYVENIIEENKRANVSTTVKQRAWLETRGEFFEKLKQTLVLNDNNNQQWVCLTRKYNTSCKDPDVEKLYVWGWLYAYFMRPEQAEELSECAEKGLSVISEDIATHHQTYKIFNREYPWSPSCKDFEKQAWVDARIKTGERETITKAREGAIAPDIEKLIRKYIGYNEEEILYKLPSTNQAFEDESYSDNDVGRNTKLQEETIEREVEKDVGKILHATTDMLWEEEYDATIETGINYSFPCAKLIEEMGLKQHALDGFWYDEKGILAAFDTYLTTEKAKGVVVRKDILDSFLQKTGLVLVWIVEAAKEIFDANSCQNRSDWEAVFVYGKEEISGDVHRLYNS